MTPLRDIPSGCCFFTGPYTATRSSLRMLRQPLQPVLLLVLFLRSRSQVVGVLGCRSLNYRQRRSRLP